MNKFSLTNRTNVIHEKFWCKVWNERSGAVQWCTAVGDANNHTIKLNIETINIG